MKNIVICCDGTNNQFSGYHTNVIHTFKLAAQTDAQVCFYDPGVGTLPQPGFSSRVAQRWSVLMGLAIGAGFLDNVADAYRYLMQVYQPGDRVYLFGFSRGAFTVRALAGLLHAVGLLRPGSENLVRYALRYWREDRGPKTAGGQLCAEFKRTMARDCPIQFIGVWDTVGSVGWVNHFATFPHTRHNPSVRHARHAVSIDERRCMFRQNLMAASPATQDVKNVWFAGVHSDVGGGYPPAEAGLAKLALEWMVVEAERCGLVIDDADFAQEVHDSGEGPNVQGELHRSLTTGWWLAELLPIKTYSFKDHARHWTMSLGRRRQITPSASDPTVAIHESVLQRMEQLPTYRPSNLPATPAEVRARFRIEPLSPRGVAAAVGVVPAPQ